MKEYISNLRCVATMGVVMLHTTGFFVENSYNINKVSWEISNFIDAFVRFCVPIFLMITGAILLNRDEPMSVFLNKRYKRILIPFAFWNTVYLVAKILLLPKGEVVDFYLIYSAIINGASQHFWYVYMILGVYLFIPIIRKWTISVTKNEVIFFLLIWTLTLFLTPYTKKYFISIELMYFSKYLGFIVLGFYLDKFCNISKGVFKGVSLFILGALATFLLTSYFSNKEQCFVPFFYEYLTPNVALMSVGIFILFKYLKLKTNSFSLLLDHYSYGIYLVHVLILKLLMLLTLSFIDIKLPLMVAIYILTIGFLTYFLSFFIIKFLSKIKFLSSIVT